MNRRCLHCGSGEFSENVLDSYEYTQSGLRGLYLEGGGVTERTCQNCGDVEISIDDLAGLHRCIASMLVSRKKRLVGTEIRFVRKFLGFNVGELAGLMGVTIETVSRWEHDKAPIGAPAERLLRLMGKVATLGNEGQVDVLKGLLQGLKVKANVPARQSCTRTEDDWAPAPTAAAV